jgi:hypothetical protein
MGHKHAKHLVATLESLDNITTEWPGKRFLGMTLKSDYYTARTVDIFMPGYTKKTLNKCQHDPSHCVQGGNYWTW